MLNLTIFPTTKKLPQKDIFLRFHGPGSLYSSPYSDEVLKEYAFKFGEWVKQGHHVWAFFNNDVGGHALHNGATLKKYVAELTD
ncbi:DUF72 domain-containing protein [Dyadobacter chenwenxiniae]|uniref:DUF72 domain-containing protein n=1 Tax=Dyadobacter chenwenxiniae TaxID=2906456 RepID=UPI0021127073|nr:DUF72 domain-containing protein [Dyadobacter chenwenxiniae]